MPDLNQAQRAELLRSLHHGPEPLLLPNAWDCASARIVEELGFPVIATTSAGVAFSLGYQDGEKIPAKEMLATVARIARVVKIPVTADLEAGYSNISETAKALIDAGGVGMNLEDFFHGALVPIEEQAARIAAVKETGAKAGVPLVINARTDIYLKQIGDPAARFDETRTRLRAFIDAGADCLFLPGVIDEELIRRFVSALNFPINILTIKGAPPLARMKELGVARISVGSGIARAAMGFTRRIATDLKNTGDWSSMIEAAIPMHEANGLFEAH